MNAASSAFLLSGFLAHSATPLLTLTRTQYASTDCNAIRHNMSIGRNGKTDNTGETISMTVHSKIEFQISNLESSIENNDRYELL